jgi:rhamnosyltransferase
VIVRTKDSADTVEKTFRTVRDQTVASEIVVVDSGSTDSTLELAERWADKIVTMPPEEWSYGRALNLGAQSASAPVHFALSSHCWLERNDYIEISLSYYGRDDVAATNGNPRSPRGEPLYDEYVQTAEDAQTDPFWGYSNHAGSWRASVWQRFPFNEEMDSCEDKEWAWRVLRAGYVIVYHPALRVSTRHRRKAGTRALFQRSRHEARALARLVPDVGPSTPIEAAAQWWNDIPDEPLYPPLFYRLNYYRAAEIFGRWLGQAEARRS